MKKNRSYVSIMLTDVNGNPSRIVNLGQYPIAWVKEFKKAATASRLYRKICELVDKFYCNEVLVQVQANGAVNAVFEGFYTPKVDRSVVYFNCSGSKVVFS